MELFPESMPYMAVGYFKILLLKFRATTGHLMAGLLNYKPCSLRALPRFAMHELNYSDRH